MIIYRSLTPKTLIEASLFQMEIMGLQERNVFYAIIPSRCFTKVPTFFKSY